MYGDKLKIVMVLDETLGPGYLANAAACIASGLFDNEKDLLGSIFTIII